MRRRQVLVSYVVAELERVTGTADAAGSRRSWLVAA